MKISTTSLPGLLLIGLDVHPDERGSFREAFHAAKLANEPRLAAFVPVQQNVSHNRRGVIRGIHGEPWEKLIHVAHGEVFAAIVDLRRDSPTFGRHETFVLGGQDALFVPRGYGNAFKALTDPAIYVYLVNEHWTPDIRYAAVAYDDPDIGIRWPDTDGIEIVSEKDRSNPSFAAFRSS
ncbi:MAG: dTDP-4-dehydrorhamnose 3,5-epimerase family protein [Actinomycetota bacterium]